MILNVMNFVMEQENINTKTEGRVKLLQDYLQSSEESRECQDNPPLELNKLLLRFFVSVRPMAKDMSLLHLEVYSKFLRGDYLILGIYT